MKTSIKLLLGLLIIILVSITVFVAVAKYYQVADAVSGNGRSVSEARQVSDFSGLQVSGRIKVTLTQGPERKVEVKADQNIVTAVQTKVEEDILHILLKNKIDRKENIEVTITMPVIKSLNLSDGASIKTTTELKGEDLTIESSSGSQAAITVQYKNMFCTAFGGSVLQFNGKVETAHVSASAGSIINAGELSANKCSVEALAGSTAEMKVLDEISADIKSGSSFTYSGEPAIRDINSSSGGMIKKK